MFSRSQENIDGCRVLMELFVPRVGQHLGKIQIPHRSHNNCNVFPLIVQCCLHWMGVAMISSISFVPFHLSLYWAYISRIWEFSIFSNISDILPIFPIFSVFPVLLIILRNRRNRRNRRNQNLPKLSKFAGFWIIVFKVHHILSNWKTEN